MQGEKVLGSFYQEKLQRSKQETYRRLFVEIIKKGKH